MNENNKISMRAALLHTRMGIAGVLILGILLVISAYVMIFGFSEHVRQWNDPTAWLLYPKSAIPLWANSEGLSEHLVIQEPKIETSIFDTMSRTSAIYTFELRKDGLPSGIIYEYVARYTGSPLLEMRILLPDGKDIELASIALPNSDQEYKYQGRMFSTDSMIHKLVAMQLGDFQNIESAIFEKEKSIAQTGTYSVIVNLYDVSDTHATITNSTLIISGGAYGIMGTDEMRRDVILGLIWGTPLALFVGITVAVASVILGLAYGVYAGYKGGKKDESMMRLNDVIYALPALPFLIILGVTISNSIFVTVSFLVVFGWVGVAKISRSMSLQAKARGYVEASKMMGHGDAHTIIRHIIPQLLPYALASIAISVPAAITTEAGLSFLGLGDPEYPTWGSMLQDANQHGAAARGLWWWIIPPGLMIAITGLAFVFIGSAFDVVANPKLKQKT